MENIEREKKIIVEEEPFWEPPIENLKRFFSKRAQSQLAICLIASVGLFIVAPVVIFLLLSVIF